MTAGVFVCLTPTVTSVIFAFSGYASFEGSVLQGSELAILAQGLESNNLLTGYTHMLTVRTIWLLPKHTTE